MTYLHPDAVSYSSRAVVAALDKSLFSSYFKVYGSEMHVLVHPQNCDDVVAAALSTILRLNSLRCRVLQ